MSKKRTDFRALQARRASALSRPELRVDAKPSVDRALVDAAIAAGRLVRLPAAKRAK